MKYILYLTTNTVNGKIYIGVHQTKNPYRFDGYIGNGVFRLGDVESKDPTPFRNAVKKYGYQAFRRVVLKVFDTAEEAYAEEARLVDKDFTIRKDTYNVSLGGRHSAKQRTKILQYSIDGKFIREFDGIVAATEYLGLKTHSSLSKALKGKIYSAKGYQWRYWTDDFPKVIPAAPPPRADVKVVKYSLDGDLIKVYSTLQSAMRELNCSKVKGRDIKRATQTLQELCGFQWRLYEDEYPEAIPRYISPRAILQLSEAGDKVLMEWPSLQDVVNAGYEKVSKALYRSGLVYGFKWIKKKDYYISNGL
jgi:hypothetical protein